MSTVQLDSLQSSSVKNSTTEMTELFNACRVFRETSWKTFT